MTKRSEFDLAGRRHTVSVKLGLNVRERIVRVLTQGTDRGQADHDDQCQHDGVLDSRGAIFGNEEVLYLLKQFHLNPPSAAESPFGTIPNARRCRVSHKFGNEPAVPSIKKRTKPVTTCSARVFKQKFYKSTCRKNPTCR